MLNSHANVLSGFLRDTRVEGLADALVKVAAGLSLLFLVSGYLALPALPVFGHDEVHYYGDFRFKLAEDGRWLNFLLHNFLRSVPLPLWSFLYVGLWCGLLYRIVRGFGFALPQALLVAATITLASPFIEMSLWPASVVPSMLLLGFALWMQERGLAYPLVYILSGMLMFGAMQGMYFLLPLLFARQFFDTTEPLAARSWLLFKHMLWWVAGSVAGVLVVCVMLRILAGIWFPQPPAWRDTHPVSDFASLLANMRRVLAYLALYLEMLLRQGGVTYGYILTCALIALLRFRTLFAQMPGLLLLAAVFLAFFVFSVPLAPVIHMRSLNAMAIAVVIGVALLPGSSAIGRVVAAALLLKLTQHYAVYGQDYFEAQRSETTVLLTQLRDLFPGYPNAYSAIALDSAMDPARPEAARLNDGSRMHPLFMTLGAREFLDCTIPQRCERIGVESAPIATVPFAGGQLELTVDTANNIGVVRFRD